ncbi:MAG: hypothetical protein IKB25_12325 [Lentisphaeria bacterium]|nr:hypothetical protein [Lentisphaeria bacterium]
MGFKHFAKAFMMAAAGIVLSGCSMFCDAPTYEGAMLGPQKFFRPRDNMTFYFYDQKGGGFDLRVTVRDLNLNLEGERPAYFFLVDPDGKIVDTKLVKDDGITKNEFRYKDGMSDIWLDLRYRAYYRKFSPNGLPPGKERSPKLDNPGKIKPQVVTLKAPKNGKKGVYRLGVSSCYDHFITVTPSRKLLEGVHPGQCGLYVHKDQFANGMYLYLPEATQAICFSTTEEVAPFGAVIETPFGKMVSGKGYFNFLKVDKAPKNQVVKFSVKTKNPGTLLHFRGAPMIVCGTEEAAKAFANFEDPAVTRLKKVKAKNPVEKEFLQRLCKFSHCFGFNHYYDAPVSAKQLKPDFRSNWWNFGDGWFKAYPKDLSAQVKADAINLMEKWACFRYTMDLSTCVNQWGKIAEQLADMYNFTKSPLIKDSAEFNVRRMCTPDATGRANPDRDTFLSGMETDSGMSSCGVMSEGFGHDNEYNLETDMHLTRVYRHLPMPEIIKYQDTYYKLKTHLTVPRQAFRPQRSFDQTVSPTDINFRTRFYTHKSSAVWDKITYGDLWIANNKDVKSTWPAMETKPFVRVLGKRYAFVNTGKYYAIVYLGWNYPLWQTWGITKDTGTTKEIVAFRGPGYGEWQIAAAKPSAISAIWVPGCGPVLLGNNHNAMYSNIMWAKVNDKLPAGEPCIDPEMTLESDAPTVRSFDEKTRTLTMKGEIPRTGLKTSRTVKLEDNKLIFNVTLMPTKDVKLKELWETVPLFAENRTLKFDGREFKFPAFKVTGTHHFHKSMEGYSGVPPFKAKKVSLTSANGKGMEIDFGKAQTLVLTQVLKYRKEAAGMSGISMKLPNTFKKGKAYSFTYTINIK